MNKYRKYIGVKPPTISSKGNLGDIWVETSRSSFIKIKGIGITPRILPTSQIERDVKNRYLISHK